MGLRFASCYLFLLLLIVLIANGSGAIHIRRQLKIYNPKLDNISKGTNVLKLHSMDELHDNDDDNAQEETHIHDHHQSPHISHLGTAVNVFFQLVDLKLGKIMPIYFPHTDSSSSPHFLPREEADAIPFSSNELPHLLQLFSLPPGSSQAEAVKDTLKQCEAEPIEGETKLCATSLESMLDFVRKILGLKSQIRVLSTTHLTKSNTHFQNYTVLETPEEIPAPKMVACHFMPYPYAIFFCHYLNSESKVFKVSLAGENGDKIEAVAVCHLDTSRWSRKHISFIVLGMEPGTSPVCHFFPSDNLVWVTSAL